MIDKVLLTLHDLIISESRQIVDDWMLTDRCLDLDEAVLGRRHLLSTIELVLVLLTLFFAVFTILIL